MSAVSPLHDTPPRRASRESLDRPLRSPLQRRTRVAAAAAVTTRSSGAALRTPQRESRVTQLAAAIPVRPVREPAVAGAPRTARPLTRTTTAAERMAQREQQRPRLEVVPRRRRAMSIAVASCVVLFVLLLGAVAFQTQLAQNQLALDNTERAVRDARERYDVLRRQRAQLRSPNRLAVEAARLGMVPAETGELITLDPATEAAVVAAAAGLPDVVADKPTSLEQFGEVKAVTGDAP